MSRTTYAQVVRLVSLLLGTGTLGFTAADPDRLRFMLGACECVVTHGPSTTCEDCAYAVEFKGCETLARELATAGALLLVAAFPAKPDAGG